MGNDRVLAIVGDRRRAGENIAVGECLRHSFTECRIVYTGQNSIAEMPLYSGVVLLVACRHRSSMKGVEIFTYGH